MVNIKFIAEKAGVSLRTVSNVLNNRNSQYNEETKKKVLDMIEKYQYLPNRIARGLRTGKSENIGLVVPDISYHPIFAKIFETINEILTVRGYNILLFNSKEDLEREKKIITNLLESNVDGVIFIRIVDKNPEIKKVIDNNIPIVACLRSTDYDEVPSVLTDNVEVGRIATEYLIKKGHRKIIHMVGNEDLLAHRDRKKGYIQTLKKYNIEARNDYLIYSDFQCLKLYEQLIDKFRELEGFTAIFSYDDIVAANCVKAINRIDKIIPEDISIVAVNNSNFLNWLEPSITTVEQPVDEVCRHSVDMLLDLINKKESPGKITKNLFLKPRFIERGSVSDINKK